MLLSKTLQAFIICLLFNIASYANNIIIVESQSYHPLHIMDQEWLNIANYHGDDAAIYPQSVLEDPATLATADALIVSSAVILLDDNKINNILTFIQNGGNVYLQTEFMATLTGNVAFQQLATDLGVSFNWDGEFAGYVTPIVLANSLATYSASPVQFDFFFYAGAGSGDQNVEVIADYLGDGVGFSIQSPTSGQGKIMTMSDQDWIRQQVNIEALDYIYQFLNTPPVVNPFVAPATLDIQATNMANCPGDIVNFAAMVDDIPTPYTLQWFINGILLPGVTSISFSTAPLAGDIITCEATFQKPAGGTCVVESNQIVVPPFSNPGVPSLNMVVNTTDLCGNETAFFTSNVSNANNLSNYSYVWKINGQVASVTPAMSASIGNFQDGQIVTCELIYDTTCDTGLSVTSNAIVMNVTTPVSPTIAIDGIATICSGEEVQLTATGVNWGNAPTFEWFVDGVSTGQNGIAFSSTTLTDGQIVTCEVLSSVDCYITNTATSNNKEIEVTTTLNPTISISASAAVCPGESITFTATGNDWATNATTEWFIDGVSTGNNSNELSGSNFVAGQIITCQLINLSNCSSVVSLTSNQLAVQFATPIVPMIEINSSPTVCPGESITYTMSGMNLGNNPQLQWYINGVATGNNTTTLTASNFAEGQIINCEISNLSSCHSVSSLISNGLIVSYLPTINSTIEISASPAGCPGETITYNATGTNWDPAGQIEWFIDGVATGNTTDELAASNFAEGQIITCELNNTSSCYSDTQLISNNLMVAFAPSIVPNIEITASPAVCPGEIITYTATGTNWDPNAQTEWFVNGIPTGNNTNELAASNFMEGQIITCELSNLSSCYSVSSLISNNLMVTFLPTTFPTIQISVSQEGCPGETIVFNATGTDWDNNSQLEWFVDGVTTGNTTDELAADNFTAGQQITCVLTNLSPCANTTSIVSNNLPVSFAPPIYPTIEITTINNTICENEMATISATGNDWGTNYQLTWFVDGQMVVSGNTDLELNINNENQVITAEIISDLDCADGTAIASNPLSFEFIEPTQPIVTVGVDAFNCTNNNYTIKADGINLGTNPAYEWYIDDINVNNTGAILNAVLMPGQTVSVTVNTTNECSAITADSNVLPIVAVELSATVVEQGDALCAGGNGFARLETTGGQAPYTYLWSDNNTSEFRTAITEGSYDVVITDANGCEDKIEVEIGFQSGPVIQDIEIDDVHCGEIYGSAFIFIESENDVTINWKNEDNQILSTETMVSNLIVGKYHVEISDVNGCFDVMEFEVQKMTAPTIAINDHIEITTGQSTELQPQFSHTNNAMTYSWSPAIGLSCTDCENPIATPLESTTYTLTITTADDCIGSAIVNIYVAETGVYVPNIFSPNGDGVNDYLLVFGGEEIVQINSMMVFNRVGETIFSKKGIQPNDEQEGWDGSFKGKKVQSGVYVYFTEVEFIDGRIEVFKGDVFVTE